MAEDKWYRLVNDKLDNIPERIESMKAKYWQRAFYFVIFVAAGAGIMGSAKYPALVGIGGMLSLTGIIGIMGMATMCHNELCLYRMIIEIRKLKED